MPFVNFGPKEGPIPGDVTIDDIGADDWSTTFRTGLSATDFIDLRDGKVRLLDADEPLVAPASLRGTTGLFELRGQGRFQPEAPEGEAGRI
jgi:hypothetical protein